MRSGQRVHDSFGKSYRLEKQGREDYVPNSGKKSIRSFIDCEDIWSSQQGAIN